MTLRERFRQDDGVSAILVCLFIVFLIIPVAAVSVDLSNAYSNRRQMQNAADAASQAGAQYMNEVRLGLVTTLTPGADLDKAVAAVAGDNDSDTTSPYACYVATVDYTTSPPSITEGPTCQSWTGDPSYTAVSVHTHRTVSTFFAGALGIGGTGSGSSSTSAAAQAAATVQKVAGAVSPFALCAEAYSNGANGSPLPYDPTQDLLNEAGTALNLSTPPIGNSYMIWGNGGGQSGLNRCGLGSSAWDGRICSASGTDCSDPIVLPGDIQVSTGAKVGPTVSLVAGYPGCSPTALSGGEPFSPCGLAAPVCSGSNGSTGTNGILHCIAWGAFVLSSTDGKSINAEYEGAANILNGTLCDPSTSDCSLSAADAYRIALVQ